VVEGKKMDVETLINQTESEKWRVGLLLEDNWLLNENLPEWCSMELSHEKTNMKVIDLLSDGRWDFSLL